MYNYFSYAYIPRLAYMDFYKTELWKHICFPLTTSMCLDNDKTEIYLL